MTSVSIIVPVPFDAEDVREQTSLVDELTWPDAETSLEVIAVVCGNRSWDLLTAERSRGLNTRAQPVSSDSERGLSNAVLRGMDKATGNVIVVMESRRSPAPESIPALVSALSENNCDLAIGCLSRPGRTATGARSLLRRLNSNAANVVARLLTSTRNPSSRCFAIRRSTFVNNRNKFDATVNDISLELIVKCDCRNICEVSIPLDGQTSDEDPQDRERLNNWSHLKRLFVYRFGDGVQLASFIAVGASGMLIDLSAFSLLLLFLPNSAARAFAIGVAMTWNFALNRRITFAASATESVFGQYLRFCGSCFVGALVNFSTSMTLLQVLPAGNLPKILAAVVGVLAGTGFNYTLCSRFVFTEEQDSSQPVSFGRWLVSWIPRPSVNRSN